MKFIKSTLLILGLACGLFNSQAQNPVFLLSSGLQATVGDSFDVHLTTNIDLTPHDIRSYSFAIQYDALLLSAVSVQYDGKLQSFSNISNTQQAGIIILTGASTTSLQGGDTLITITFRALSSGSSGLNFVPSESLLNEGTPQATYTNGSVYIAPRPTIYVNPNNTFLAVGQTVQCSVGGNKTEPITWGLTNPLVGNISSTGLFTATGHGMTKVFAEDAAGLRDTTDGVFNITAVRLFFPFQMEQWQGWEIEIPIRCSDFSSLNIVSGQFAVNYRSDVLRFISANSMGTLLSNAVVSATETTPGKMMLAFASNQAISNSNDTLVKLRFLVKREATAVSSLSFSEVLFNETVEAVTENGNFRPIILPTLSITPLVTSMVAGDSVLLTASNGVEPYTWTVSDERVAFVNPDGWLTAKEGGTVSVTVTDSVGATKSINAITVYDMRIYFPADTLERINSVTLTACFSDSIPIGRPSVSSFESEIAVTNANVKILDVITDSCLTEGWQKTIIRVSDQRIKVYLAGATPFRERGIIFYLKTELKPNFKEYYTSEIKFYNSLVNEGTPTPVLIDGSIEGKLFTPQDRVVCLGDSIGDIYIPNLGGRQVTYWIKRLRRPKSNATSWQNIYVTDSVYNELPNMLGEWEYKAVIGSEEVKVANILVETVPEVIGKIYGDSIICQANGNMHYYVKRHAKATEYRWNYTGSGVVLHPSENVLDMEITPYMTPGYLEMQPANSCGGSDDILRMALYPPISTNISEALCQNNTPYIFGTQQLTESGTYVEVFTAQNGCDSTVTLTLTVNETKEASVSDTLCQSETPYIFGTQQLTESGTYVEVFTAQNGCDSTVTLTLTVNETKVASVSDTLCQSETPYIFGTQQLTESGTYVEVFTAQNGCDSTVTLTLTVNETKVASVSDTLCQSETPYIFGTQQLTESGTYVEVFTAQNGCDSTVTLTLTVNEVNVSVDSSQDILTSLATNATYRWLDCNNDSIPIDGAVGQSFIPTESGSYAVEITQNGCIGVSDCYQVVVPGIELGKYDKDLQFHPNPTYDMIEIRGVDADALVSVYDITGRKLVTKTLQNGRLNLSHLAEGVYIIEAQMLRGKIVKK